MSATKPSLGKRFTTELLGTFMLVFMGTFAVTTGQNVLNIGLAFAVAAIGAIYAFGHASGAHPHPEIQKTTTFIPALTILSATEKESPSGFAGLAIGLVLGINVMLSANVSGG